MSEYNRARRYSKKSVSEMFRRVTPAPRAGSNRDTWFTASLSKNKPGLLLEEKSIVGNNRLSYDQEEPNHILLSKPPNHAC